MKRNNMPYKRANARKPFQKECSISDELAGIKSLAVDISMWGLGVLVSGQMPYKKGDILFADIKSLNYSSLAEVCWTKKDKDSTRAGLNLLTNQII